MKNSKSLSTLGLGLACAAITFSLAVCAQAQTVTYLAKFGGNNGSEPFGSAVQATYGNFYGTTAFGGNGNANVFRMTPSRQVTTLHTFSTLSNCVDGSGGGSPPIQGRDGNFYGVTDAGGTEGGGVFYELTAAGSYRVLHNFCSPSVQCAEGSLPNQIVQDAKGNFFGTTNGGAAVFEITSAGEYK